MRTIVDIPEDQIKALDSMGKKHDLSRAELVRRAVQKYIDAETKKLAGDIDKYYGFLEGSGAFENRDGLEYQRTMRAEWDHRDEMYGRWGFQDSEGNKFDHQDKKEKS